MIKPYKIEQLNGLIKFIFHPKLKKIRLYILSDIHFGSSYHDEVHFVEVLNKILEDTSAFCIMNGDNLEMITKHCKIPSGQQTYSNDVQLKVLVSFMKKLGDKLLLIRGGNHEYRVTKHTDLSVIEAAAMMLNKPVLPMGMAEIQIKLGKTLTRVVSTHGEGGKSEVLFDRMQQRYSGAHIYIRGHTHRLGVACSKQVCILNEEGMHSQTSLLIESGSFIKDPNYILDKNLLPEPTGCVSIGITEEGLDLNSIRFHLKIKEVTHE